MSIEDNKAIVGGGTHRRSLRRHAIGSVPAGWGKTMRFTGTTVLKVENGLITEVTV